MEIENELEDLLASDFPNDGDVFVSVGLLKKLLSRYRKSGVSNLLVCPSCGSKNINEGGGDFDYALISCRDCKTFISKRSRSDVVNAWNNRL